MFEGDDDDFSFIDEDFLKDALQPADSQPSTSRNEEVQKVNPEKTIINLNKKPIYVNGRDASNKNISDLGSGFVASNGKSNSIIKPVVKTSDKSRDTAVDVDFEFDDFFDSFGEGDNFDGLGVQNTPPDSEFTEVSAQKSSDQVQCKDKDDRTSQTSSDFRARILQTLQVNKHVSKSKNGECLSNEESRSVSAGSVCVTNVEKRKRTNSCDLNADNIGSSVKRKQVGQSPFSHLRETECEQEFPSGSSFITPLKPAPASVRRSVSPGGPIIQKRKFPGPAGILPQLGSKTAALTAQQLQEEDQSTGTSISKDIVCSQSSADEFVQGPWQQMSDDLEQDQPHHTSPLAVFNIKWVLRRASLRGQAGVRKIPFLAVMVRSIDATLLDATVILKDRTGEMSGTVQSSVLEEYGHALQPGCVLLLKDVTLLSPVSLKSVAGGIESTRRHYLNVTLNTILTIYSPDDSGHVITTTVCEMDKKELFKRAAALKTMAAPRAIVEEEEEEVHEKNHEQKQSLFSNVNAYGGSPGQSNQFHHNTNYRPPRPNANTPLPPGSPHQQQRFMYNSPVNNNHRMPNHPANNSPRVGVMNNSQKFSARVGMANQSPRIGSPNVNGLNKPQRFNSPSNANGLVKPRRFNSPSLQPPSASASSQRSFKTCGPLTPPGKTLGGSSCIDNSQMNRSIFRSQQEEKEVSDLLEGVDADSLFGDF